MSIRTTLTLDDDVAAKLKEESQERGVPFRTLVNDAIRNGLLAMSTRPQRKSYKVKAFDLGAQTGLNFDDIGSLLDLSEGEFRR